jgi:hypothetical protein
MMILGSSLKQRIIKYVSPCEECQQKFSIIRVFPKTNHVLGRLTLMASPGIRGMEERRLTQIPFAPNEEPGSKL